MPQLCYDRKRFAHGCRQSNSDCLLLLAQADDAGGRVESDRFLLVLQCWLDGIQKCCIAAHADGGDCSGTNHPLLVACRLGQSRSALRVFVT